jgi:hypothetical protein
MIEIFKASVINLRELKNQRTNIKRLFNQSIKRKDNSSFSALTKLYALLYSSFAELCFLKVIHTPYGFSEDKIIQITSERNLEQKWLKCLELAFSSINNIANEGEIQNKKQILKRHINQFIIDPSQLRNKIAHGQWIVALNNDNTAINRIITNQINNLDFVKTDILFYIYEKIGQAVEDLIESPKKAHFNDFYSHMTELEELIVDTKNWDLESKKQKLKDKFERIEKIKLKRAAQLK